MNIKLIDFVKLIDNCKSIPELKIKCDLLYGIDFEIIISKFCNYMGCQIEYDILLSLDNQNLARLLKHFGKQFEESKKSYIQKSTDFELNQCNRYTVVYYLPECFEFENISINI